MKTDITPKEKAEELIAKFYTINAETVELVDGDFDMIHSLSEDDAIKCARVAVYEILDHCTEVSKYYWLKVLHELIPNGNEDQG
jgi:hypothetical protein